MKKSYMENVFNSIETANREALHYGDGKAWDNKKKKTMKRQGGRGKVLKRLWKLEMHKEHNKLIELIERASKMLEEKKAGEIGGEKVL